MFSLTLNLHQKRIQNPRILVMELLVSLTATSISAVFSCDDVPVFTVRRHLTQTYHTYTAK